MLPCLPSSYFLLWNIKSSHNKRLIIADPLKSFLCVRKTFPRLPHFGSSSIFAGWLLRMEDGLEMIVEEIRTLLQSLAQRKILRWNTT